MSRYRNIHCLVWNDDKFPFVSDDCQLVWFHLFTTPLTTPIGIFKAPVEGLAAEKRWPLPRYMKAFREGLAKGFWKYDERYHVILFPRFFNHNKPGNPNVLIAWVKHYTEIPNCELKNESIETLKAFAEAWGKPFVKVCESIGVCFPKQEQEQEQEQDNKPPTPPEKKNGKFKPPTQAEVVDYFRLKGYAEAAAKKAHEYYETADWHDAQGNKVKNWKQKMLSVWFKPENEIKPQPPKLEKIYCPGIPK